MTSELTCEATPGPEVGGAPVPVPVDDPSRFFRTDHLLAELKHRSVRGGLMTLTAQATKFVLQTGSTIVLARLLAPSEFGLVAMVTAVTGFVAMFKDAGLSMATVQRDEITHAQVSTLFWINVALSLGAMAVVAALAPVIAWFYGEPRLVWITLVLAGSFVFGGLTVQHQALLRRQMRFRILATIDIVSMLAGVVTAIVMAASGFGYWSLVGMAVAAAVTNCVQVWMASPWRPGLPRRRAGTRPMLAFGGTITLVALVAYLMSSLPSVLMGAVFGGHALGLYSRASALLLLPMTQVITATNAVMVPALSRMAGDRARLANAYRRLVVVVGAAAALLIPPIIGASDWVVAVALGSQWTEAAGLLVALGALAFFEPLARVTHLLFLAQGRADLYLKWTLFSFVLVVAALPIGLCWGALGLVTSYVVAAGCIRVPLLFWYVGRHTSIRVATILGALAPSLASALAVLLAVVVTRLTLSAIAPLGGLVVCAGVALAVWAVTFCLVPGGSETTMAIRSLIQGLRARDVTQARATDSGISSCG